MDKIAPKLSFIRDHYIDAVIGKEIFPVVTRFPHADNPIAIVSDFFLRKATKTLDAICILCEAGFAEDALVLGRTIFELSLHLQTIASASSIEQRQHKARCFIYDGDRERVAKLKRLAELRKQGKCLSWIKDIEASNPVFKTITMPKDFVRPKKIWEMASELGKTESGGEWECWYFFLYWSLSNLTHPSGIGSHTYLQACDQEAETSRAMTFALTMHYFLTICVLSMLDLEGLRPQLDECVERIISLSKFSDTS